MTDVFISYSRKDKEFVTRLHNTLANQQRDVWVDWEDIPATADWWKEVTSGIEQADSFVFVISPDSVRSEVCRNELNHAVANNKRFVPLLRREVTDPADMKLMHPVISSHNWIYFRDQDDFDNAFKLLTTALDTDLSNVRAHTRLLVRAHEWEDANKNSSLLLQGDDLKNAEAWLAQAVARKPAPTPLHAEYIAASRQAATNRQRQLLAGVSVALVISIALALLSLALFGEANTQRTIADEQAATAISAQGKAEQQAIRADNNAATAVVAQQNAQFAATDVAIERNTSQSIAISGQALVELGGTRKERAVPLALIAFQTKPTWQAERALAEAVEVSLAHITLNGHSGRVTDVDWGTTRSAKLLATGSDDQTVRIWDLQGNQLAILEGHTSPITRVRWSPDGTLIATASADGNAMIWSISSDYQTQAQATLLHLLSGHTNRINMVDWSPDGKRLVTASNDTTAIIWDVESGGPIFTLRGHLQAVNSAYWSPDGTRIVTGSNDATAKVWDPTTGKLLMDGKGHRLAVLRAVWSPDGTQIASASADNMVIVWDVVSGTERYTLTGHIGRVTRLEWSGTGDRIATASADGTAKIWNAEDGSLLRTLFGHDKAVRTLEWSPGDNRLITASDDGTARIWYTESGGQLLTFSGHTAPITAMEWSPDGQWFATGSDDGTARIWQIWKNAAGLISFARKCCVERNLTDEENIQFGLPTATPAPSPTAPAIAPSPAPDCPLNLSPRLYIGARGSVTIDVEDPRPVNVREQPGVTSRQVGQVAQGQTFQVVSGPVCANDVYWFEVIYGISAVRGWLAEGQNGVYFVEPMG
ncbi:MAG: TIR domain-containing protein [Anaerolineae bacterium]